MKSEGLTDLPSEGFPFPKLAQRDIYPGLPLKIFEEGDFKTCQHLILAVKADFMAE